MSSNETYRSTIASTELPIWSPQAEFHLAIQAVAIITIRVDIFVTLISLYHIAIRDGDVRELGSKSNTRGIAREHPEFLAVSRGTGIDRKAAETSQPR
jgi:hypothetical protein